MISSRHILLLVFISIFTSTFYLFFQESFPLLFSIINNVDEFVVVFILLYVLIVNVKKGYTNVNLLWLLLLFVICGVVGNVVMHSGANVCILGCFNTLKPIILFWSLTQINFVWSDFHYFFKLFSRFFIIIVIAYIFDGLFPGFRASFGREIREDHLRGNLRALCGIFYRPTFATIWGCVYYVYYKFYSNDKYSKWKYWFSILMNLLSLKIKDLLGFFSARVSLLFKSISGSKVMMIFFVIFLLFVLYASIMTEHFELYFGGDYDDSKIARVVLTVTSIKIGLDYFPFGVGFGMYASPISRQTESFVYQMYGIHHVYGLDFARDGGMFMCDTFWPMLIGETGFLGLLVYIIILWYCFNKFFRRYLQNTRDLNVLFPCFLFIVLLVETLGKPTIVGPPHSLVLWSIAGLFYSLKDKPYQINKI